MGKYSDITGPKARDDALNWLKPNSLNCLNGSSNDFIVFIITIAQYLYGLFYKCGVYNENTDTYTITATTVSQHIDESFSELVLALIRLRNLLCHEHGNASTLKSLNEMLERKNEINDLLKYLKIIEETDFYKMSRAKKICYVLEQYDVDVTDDMVDKCLQLLSDNMYEDEDVLDCAIALILDL